MANLNDFIDIRIDPNTWAYPIDIKPAAQHITSTSISEPTGSAVTKIKALEAYYFYTNSLAQTFGWDRPEDVGSVPPRRLGLIAQELQLVEPSLVRVMDWLESDEDYYWIDYEALYVLCLDAINELNARAEAAKVALNITPAETYPARVSTTTLVPSASNFQLSVTPTVSAEGSQSVWTLTADNAPDGLCVGFKISGDCNQNDITCSDDAVLFYTLDETEYIAGDDDVFDPIVEGFAYGIFTFLNGTAQVTLDYVLDTEAEGDETIIMTMKPGDSKGGPGPVNVSATATITD